MRVVQWNPRRRGAAQPTERGWRVQRWVDGERPPEWDKEALLDAFPGDLWRARIPGRNAPDRTNVHEKSLLTSEMARE